MKSVFIYGITGEVGYRTAVLLKERGFRVGGLARSDDKATLLEAQGFLIVRGDLSDASPEQHNHWLENFDVVIFTAGAHSEDESLLNSIDYGGVVNSATGAEQAGIGAYVLISAFPEAGRQRDTTSGFEYYMECKKRADAWLVQSQLDWTIIRPGRLTDDPPFGAISASAALPYGEITRADLASFVTDVVESNAFSRQIIEVINQL